jgi:hypothetical protein
MGLTLISVTGTYKDPAGNLLKGKRIKFSPAGVFGDSGIIVPPTIARVTTDQTTAAFSIDLYTSDVANAYVRYEVSFHDGTVKSFDLTDDLTSISLEDLINAFDPVQAPSASSDWLDHEGRIVALEAATASGVTDGDKGDVVVSSGGTVWTIEDERIEDIIGNKVVAGSNVTVSYNDTTGETTVSATGGGGAGTVDTANSPNANEFARFTDSDTIEGLTVSETKTALSLGNVDNTSDANKPVSTAQATADAAVQAAAIQRANHTGTQSADTLTDGTTNKAFLATERTKLSGIATGATANDTDANLKARANHTGTQLASTISDFNSAALLAAPAETTTTEGALINGATSKATPVDADYVGLMDSAASNILKKLSWANIKATLKTYYDTLYQPVDSDLTTIAGLTATTDSFIQSKASAWAARTIAQVKADLGLTGTNSGDQNLFSTVAVSGQSNVVADSTSDTLTFVAGTNVTITTDASTDAVTISASLAGGAVDVSGTPTAGQAAQFVDANTIEGVDAVNFSGLSAKTALVDADQILTADSEASGNPKSTTWTAIKAFLKTHFDTLYATIGHNHTGTYQPLDSDLTTIAGLTATTNNFLIAVSSAWASRTPSQALTTLGLSTSDSPQFTGIELGHASDTTLTRASAGEVNIEGNRIYRAGGTDVPLADGGTGASLVDPNADRIMFWDDSAGAIDWLTPGTGLSITGTTLSATGGGGSSTFYKNLFDSANLNPDTSGNVYWEPAAIKRTNDFFQEGVWVFNNPSADESLYGSIELPRGSAGNAAINIIWSSTATSGTVQWSFAYRVITADDTNSLDQSSAVQTATNSDTAPTAANRRMVTAMTVTDANFGTAGTLQWKLTRVDASDTLAAAVMVTALNLSYD